MEFDVWPELYADCLAVGGGLVREGELRHNIKLLVDIEQLVAKRCKDDASDIGPGERGIEHVRIFGQPDPQRRLSCRQPAGKSDVCGRRGGPTNDLHGSLRAVVTDGWPCRSGLST